MNMRNRYTKTILSAAAACYVALVCFNNTVDYDANYQFVVHVTSMDDIFSREHNGWRALQAPWAHHVLYLVIIAIEYVIAFLLLRGTRSMWLARKADAETFRHAGRYTATGLLLAVLLWFFVFVVVAGEWFLMWQSKTWNGENTAFTLTIVLLLLLIHHNGKDE
jgi:predicted small integral membrane protein